MKINPINTKTERNCKRIILANIIILTGVLGFALGRKLNRVV